MEQRNTEFLDQPKGQLKPESQNLELQERSWLSRLKEHFNQVFRRGEKGREPSLSFDLFYAPHASKEDFKGLDAKFLRAYIYIPEGFGWSPAYLKDIQDVASGKRTSQEFMQERTELEPGYPDSSLFEQEELKMIYRSKKPVILIDAPHNHPLVERSDKVVSNDWKIDFKSDFNEILQSIKNNYRSLADIQREREEYMLSHLEPTIRQLFKDFPALKKKQHLKILIRVGSFHTFLYHALKKEYKAVERNTPLSFKIGTEVIRRYRFGKEVDDTMVARSALDRLLGLSAFKDWHDIKTKNTSKKDQFRRYVCSKFSLEEIKEIFQAWRQDNLTFIDRKIEEKGIVFPSSEEELDAFLAKPLPRQDTIRE